MTSVDHTETLRAIVGESNVERLAKDCWRLAPSTAVEITAILRFASKSKLTVAAQSKVKTPQAQLLIDLHRLNHVVRLDETSLTVHAQAGMLVGDLQDILERRNLTLGDYPQSLLNSNVGSMIRYGVNGTGSPLYGTVEDGIIGISAVLASGRTIHTRIAPRRATGPDVAKLFCGSGGTCGIVTSAVLRIHRQPNARFVVACRLPDFGSALNAMHLALRDDAIPESMQIWNAVATQTLLNIDIPPQAALLVASTAGQIDLAACDRNLVRSACQACGGESIQQDIAETWRAQRNSIDTISLRVTASTKHQQPAHDAIVKAASQYSGRLGAIAQCISNDATTLSFAVYDQGSFQRIPEPTRSLLCDAANQFGASIVGAPHQQLADDFRTLQQLLDPDQILSHSLPAANAAKG